MRPGQKCRNNAGTYEVFVYLTHSAAVISAKARRLKDFRSDAAEGRHQVRARRVVAAGVARVVGATEPDCTGGRPEPPEVGGPGVPLFLDSIGLCCVVGNLLSS